MRWFILFTFLGAFLVRNVTPSVVHRYPSNLGWLFGLSDKSSDIMDKEQNVCQTDECKHIANVILDSMNKSVDPCDDFYEYACGKWALNNPIPKGKSEWSLFNILQEKVEMQIKDILKEGSKEDDLLAVKLAKKWFIACMDTDAMHKQGLDPLISTLSRFGGWPIIMDPDEWDKTEYSWQKVDNQYARLVGRNAFHDVRVNRDDSDENDITVHIDTPHLPPGSYRLWGESYDSDEAKSDESDEDPSDENKQSEEDTPDPGSEGEDDDSNDSSGYYNDDDDDDDDDDYNGDDDDDSDDNDDDEDDEDDDDDDDYYDYDYDIDNDIDDENGEKSNNNYEDSDYDINNDNNYDINDGNNDIDEQDKSEDIRKRKKSSGKLSHKKKNVEMHRKKSIHNKKRKSHDQIVKRHNNRKEKKQRIKRHVLTTKTHSKHTSRSVHRNKANERKARKHKKISHNVEEIDILSTTTENPNENDVVLLRQYINYISKVAHALAKERGLKIPKEQIEKDVEDMVDFQLELININMETGEDLELSLSKFQKWYDKKHHENDDSRINWMYKITDLFGEAGVTVDRYLTIKVGSPNYFKKLASLLDKTPSRTIVNYIHWNFLSKMIITTTNEMRELYNEWQNNKDKEKKDRQSTCIKEAEMSDILSYEYVGKHFSDEISKTGMSMIDDIQQEVEYLIRESDWMDEDTKKFVLDKLRNMKKFVGYPNWYRNTTIVERHFKGLVMGNSYYENTLSYNRYNKWHKLRLLLKKEDENDVWWINPVTVNAIFDPEENSIAITAADFQSPFFAYNRPQAINFGILGFIMAHEVNHGFDDSGHLYDKNGNFMEWLSAMAEAYDKKAMCFVEQFNNYPVDKETNKTLKNYGNQTVGENIADTMGLQAVFKAYQRRVRECGKPDSTLPGLEELSNRQLFFLSFANTWCEAMADSETTIMSATVDSHSTGRLRVIGSVSNSEEFSKAYNCPVGSAMNPENKCNIWK